MRARSVAGQSDAQAASQAVGVEMKTLPVKMKKSSQKGEEMQACEHVRTTRVQGLRIGDSRNICWYDLRTGFLIAYNRCVSRSGTCYRLGERYQYQTIRLYHVS